MNRLFQKKRTLKAVAFQSLAFAASVGLLALSSQFSHAATTGSANSEYISEAQNSIDSNFEADAELTDLSLYINLNPYGHRGRHSRRVQKDYTYVPRRSYTHKYPYSSRYKAYSRHGRPIYREHGHRSGSRSRHSYRHGRRYNYRHN